MFQPIHYFLLLMNSLNSGLNVFELFDFAPSLFELVVHVVLIKNDDLRIVEKLLLNLTYFQLDVVWAALLNRPFKLRHLLSVFRSLLSLLVQCFRQDLIVVLLGLKFGLAIVESLRQRVDL